VGTDAQQDQHNMQAVVSVPEDQGRVNRTSAGDANNDGYNETTGDYRIVAEARQVDVTLTPRTPALFHPVVQVSGLPAGKVVATVEGRLIDEVVRLPGGNVLVEIPVQVDHVTTLSLRVR